MVGVVVVVGAIVVEVVVGAEVVMSGVELVLSAPSIVVC